MRFIHGYMKDCWDGLVRRGLIDDTSGVKIHHHYDVPSENRFNEIAREGGKLFEIVRECARPIYCDRMQGGWWFLPYMFNPALLALYKEISGDWMLGLQIHEWASNMNSDWERILSGADGILPQNPDRIRLAATRPSHKTGESRPFLESGSAEEYAQLTPPSCMDDSLVQYRQRYQNRRDTHSSKIYQNGNNFDPRDSMLLPCDSYYQTTRMELQYGARALMPEIGAQIPLARMQVAFVRGMARAQGIQQNKPVKWGTYYEPWGGDPMGCACYQRDLKNEWYVTNPRSDLFGGGFSSNSGSSRLLQKRLYYWSLLSGADFMSEEWGTANTFYDWNDFELSPYGIVKRDFLSFCSKNKELGKPFIPVVLVLPREFEVFDISYLSSSSVNSYIGYPLSNEHAKDFAFLRSILRRLFCSEPSGDLVLNGNEAHVLTASPFPDIFDIVYEDAGELVLNQYTLVVSLLRKKKLQGLYPSLSGKIIEDGDADRRIGILQSVIKNLLPVTVNGEVSFIINQTENGWTAGIFNNRGVYRSEARGDTVYHEATATVTVQGPGVPDVLYGKTELANTDSGDVCIIPPGEFIMLEWRNNK
jgi:hypothetical protein